MFDAIQNELQYRFGTQGANEGKVRKGPDGQYNIGLIGRLTGVTPEMMTNAGNAFDRRTFAGTAEGEKAASYGLLPESGAVNRFEIGKGVRKAETVESLQQQATGLGVKNALDMTDVGVLSDAIRSQTETNKNNSYLNSPQVKEESRRYYADRKDARDALAFSREDAQNQRMFARRESSLDRAQTQDLAILSQGHQMKIAQMNQDLAEKRMDYDRETKRMDKRDRMIAQLMSGLGSLGSAF